jgi:alcohol dehydrogenase class IV
MFEFVNNRQLIFGENKITEIPGLVSWHGCKKVFFVVYSKSARAWSEIAQSLKDKGIEVVTYDQVQGEPDLHVINSGRDLYIKEACDCTLALGGGSVIDAAKAINMLAANGGNAEQYQMEGRQVTKAPPLFIAVPTTSGTGAEATKICVVTNNYNGLKKSIYHPTMIADIAILDPTLTLSLPAKITAATGMDALSHAIESFVSLSANPFSEMYGLKAIELINEHFVATIKKPDCLNARSGMMLASYLGGCAITANIGIAHIMAQPLGAFFNIPHGDACSVFLPASMELNLTYAPEKYARIAQAMGIFDSALSAQANGKKAIERVRNIRRETGAPESLAPYISGKEPDITAIIDTVMRSTGHIKCNPRPLNEELIKEIYGMCR